MGKWNETRGRIAGIVVAGFCLVATVASGEDCSEALEALRERLRCREIWVVGAEQYGNPDRDLPADFEINRGAYYDMLATPQDADVFICGLQFEPALHFQDRA